MTPPLFVPALGRSLYPGASVALDFTRNLYRSGTPVVKGSPSLLSGWTFTRASTGYAETAAGALVAFASGAPRITDKGLLVEESRTNLLLRSQEFDNASWTKGNTTISANAVTAPDGTLTADTLVENSSSAQHQQFQGVVLTAASYTWSVYVKQAPGSQRWLSLYPQGTGVNAFAIFDLALGTVTLTGLAQYLSSSITALAGGWYRCSITFTAAAVTVNCVSYLSNANNANSPTYLGDGASGLYFWGSQVELGSFPTSYIPTTTASATRAADVATIATAALSYPLTLFTSAALIGAITANARLLAVNDGSNANRAELYTGSSLRAFMKITTASVDQADTGPVSTFTVGATFKAAMRAATNDAAISLNGGTVTQDVSVTLPATPTAINIGTQAGGSAPANAYIKQAVIYPTAFTDAQLQGATA